MKAVLATLVCAILITTPLHAQDEPIVRTPFHSAAEVVALTVTVQNHDGTFPGRLAPDDFQVFENGVPQTISYFDAGSVPVDLTLLIDSSASMNAILPAVKHAASTLVESLSAQDRASILTFGGRVRQRAPLTSEHKVLVDAIKGMTADGNTPLFDALYVALKNFGQSRSASEVRRRAIVVLSDGDDTASLTSYDTVLELAREAGVAIYTVTLKAPGPARDGHTMKNDFQMRRLAEETGARALVALEQSHLDPLYRSIATELAHQYSLGYVPGVALLKHQFARIAIAVRGPNLTVRARSGYVAGN